MPESQDRSKIMPLAEAVKNLIHDRDTLSIANFASPIANAALHEVIRQQKRDLEIVIASSFIEIDALAETGCMRKLIHSYHAHPFQGERPFDRGVRKYGIEVVDYTNYTMAAMFMAGAMNLPVFAAYPSLMVSDIYKKDGDKKFRVIDNPFNEGEKIVLVPALKPDVAVLHVQRVDTDGNVQLWGPLGTSKHAAMAAKRIIITAEELVDKDVVRLSPNNTIIPSFRVDAICIEPWAGHPFDCLGYYDIDLQFCAMVYVQNRTEEGTKTWLDEWVFGVKDRADYMNHYADRFGANRLDKLRAKSLPSASVNLGGNFMTEYEQREIDRKLVDTAPDLFDVEVN